MTSFEISRSKHKISLKKRILESWQWWLLLLPGLVYLIIFTYIPMGGVVIAFNNYRSSRGIFASKWVGFDNFVRFFQYPDMLKLIFNTLSITLLNLAMFPIPICFALILNEVRNQKLKKTVQMLTYIPHFLSEVVVCSLVILFLNKENGVITDVLCGLGMERKNLLGVPEAFPWIYSLMGEWQGFGWSSILYISALAGVPQENVEAATIDGANRFQIIRHINIPAILPTIIITFILKLGGLMNVGYSKIYLLQNSLNLPSSRVISTYVYEIGLIAGQYSYSTAITLTNKSGYKEKYDNSVDAYYRLNRYYAWINNLTTVRISMLYCTAEESERITDIQSVLDSYIRENFAKFVTGGRSLDEFDAYQEELKQLGIEELLDIYQRGYEPYIDSVFN